MKKVWALLLSLAMILTVASFPTFAEDAALDLTNNATITMGFENLIDGDTSTMWRKTDSNRADVTFELTLHGTADISKLVLGLGSPENNTMGPGGWTVEFAGTDGDYTAMEKIESTGSVDWVHQDVTYDNLTYTAVKSVRVTLKFNTENDVAAYELSLFGNGTFDSKATIVNGTSDKGAWDETSKDTFDHAYDGNLSTSYSTQQSPVTMDFELDGYYDLTEIAAHFGADWGSTVPGKMDVLVSADGTNYTSAATYSSSEKPQRLTLVLPMDSTAATGVRFVRVKVETAQWAIICQEITFYGTKVAAPAKIIGATTNTTKWGDLEVSAAYDGNIKRTYNVATNTMTGVMNFVTFELDKWYDLSTFDVTFGVWDDTDSSTNRFNVYVSSDGVDFKKAYVFDQTETLGKGIHTLSDLAFDAETAKNAKFVRLEVLKTSEMDTAGIWLLSLAEFSVRGEPLSTTETVPEKAAVVSATTKNVNKKTAVGALKNTYDGSEGTVYAPDWQGEDDDREITWMLDSFYDLSYVQFVWYGSWGDPAAQIYAVSVSSDGVDWETVKSVNDSTSAKEGRIDTLAVETKNVKYVRIEIDKAASGYLALAEATFYGAKNASGLTSKGAQMRLDNGTVTAGLRFATTIDKATFGIGESYSYADNNDVTFGMYLLPKDKLGEYSTLLDYINANTMGEAVNVVGKNVYSQDANELTYTAVLTQIPEASYNCDVVALPYVISNGNTVYGTEMTRSYYSVAKAMRTSGAELTEAQIAALDAIINAVENA